MRAHEHVHALTVKYPLSFWQLELGSPWPRLNKRKGRGEHGARLGSMAACTHRVRHRATPTYDLGGDN